MILIVNVSGTNSNLFRLVWWELIFDFGESIFCFLFYFYFFVSVDFQVRLIFWGIKMQKPNRIALNTKIGSLSVLLYSIYIWEWNEKLKEEQKKKNLLKRIR